MKPWQKQLQLAWRRRSVASGVLVQSLQGLTIAAAATDVC